MIKELRVSNLRRHADTHIKLNEGDRIICVSGKNGAGKSTIIEAIVYALVGESRNGRAKLDKLVRRGAEIEGMEVELAFDVDGGEYRIIRRRDNKTSSALMTVNGEPLCEGVRAVTEAVENLLGMDSQGIKLAVVAQQKELDLLSKLNGSARVKAVGRLLRLDALERSKDEARQRWRLAKTALEAIPETEDLQSLSQRAARAQAAFEATDRAEQACRTAVAELEAELAVGSDVDREWHAFCQQRAAREAVVSSLNARQERITAELREMEMPEAIELREDPETVERDKKNVDASIARAEASKEINEQRSMLEGEITKIKQRLTELSNLDPDDISKEEEESRKKASEAREESLAASESREKLREELGGLRSTLEEKRRKIAAIDTLEGSCDTCGQDIPETHIEGMREKLTRELSDIELRMEETISLGVLTKETLEKLQREESLHTKRASDLSREAAEASRAVGERDELTRRLETYTGHLSRTTTSDIDIDSLYRERTNVALREGHIEEVRSIESVRREKMSRKDALDRELSEITTERNVAEIQDIGASDALDLEQRYKVRSEKNDSYRAELVMLGEVAKESAKAQEILSVINAELRHAGSLVAARRRQQEIGTNANSAWKLLGDAEKHIGEQVRPMIESSVSQILDSMSEGRFSSVKVTPDYEFLVDDGGEWRQMSEISGGESDLVSLAVRLGIADVMCSRAGSVGFLILDEVFGSQDQQRRDSILNSIRSLSGTYGQVWCISHVGGLEDTADRVLEVEIDKDGVAHVS